MAAAVAAVALAAAVLVPASAASTDPGAGTPVNERRIIGYSVAHRPIVAYRLGNSQARPTAVLLGQMHGDEHAGVILARSIVHGRRAVEGINLWVVPTMNPDGLAAGTRRNAHGVDLNRNFPVRWIRQHGDYNSGRRPASEPETRAIMRFLKDVRPAYVVSFHQPLYGVDNSYSKTRALAARLSTDLGLPLKAFNCNRGCHGTLTQWFNKKLPGAALTVEYGKPMTLRQKYVSGPAGLLAAIGATR